MRRAQVAAPRGDTKITLLRSRVHPGVPGVYHVALLAERSVVLEHGPVRTPANVNEYDRVIQLPNVDLTLEQLLAYENSLPKKYTLGFRDCRHHVMDLLDYLYSDSV